MPGKKDYGLGNYNFGDAVRSVYHEIYVHVADIVNSGYKKLTSNSMIAEYEFRAYYESYAVPGLPEGNNKLGVWSRLVNSMDPKVGAIRQMTITQRDNSISQIINVHHYIYPNLR